MEDKNIMKKAQWIHRELDGLLWLKIIYVVGIIFIELKRDEVKNVNISRKSKRWIKERVLTCLNSSLFNSRKSIPKT